MATAVEIITLIIGALEQVPLAFWTGVGGASIPLITLIFTNRQKNREQARQHEHDADEKLKQRLAELRRSVYLNGAEEVVKANVTIGSLPMIDLQKVDLGKELQGFFASMMKLQMVCTPETVQLANDLASTYAEVLGQTITKVMPIKNVSTDLSVQDSLYEGHKLEFDRLLAASNASRESGVAEPAKFDALNASFQYQHKRMTEINVVRDGLRAKHLKLHMEFMHSITGIMASLTEQQGPLLAAIRRELDVGGDVEFFKAMLAKQAKRMQGMTDRAGAELLQQSEQNAG